MRPEDFELITDYTTVKNDGNEVFTITIGGSQAIGGGSIRQWTQTKTVGSKGGFDLIQVTYTGRTDRLAGPIVILSRDGTAPGWGTLTYQIRIQVSRTSPTQLTATAEIFNYADTTLTTNAAAITFTIYATTFLPPFS